MSQLDCSDLIGRPYDHKTFNCWTLCREIYRRLGISLPDYPYSRFAHIRADIITNARYQFRRLDAPVQYCLVLFNYYIWPSHIGVVLTPDCRHFIHARPHVGVVIESLKDPKWAQRVEGYYEYKGCGHS